MKPEELLPSEKLLPKEHRGAYQTTQMLYKVIDLLEVEHKEALEIIKSMAHLLSSRQISMMHDQTLYHRYKAFMKKYEPVNESPKIDKIPIDFIALVTFKPENEGGRKNPIESGYRPQIKFIFQKEAEMQASVELVFPKVKIAQPIDIIDAEVRIIASTDYFKDKLNEGDKFEIREGMKIVGMGHITKIINSKLQKKIDNVTI